MKASETFLNSFNRVEKWLREALGNPKNIGFSEMVRRLSRNRDSQVKIFQDDLLQLAQLRNAIVHEKIGDDFVIAEPNEWAVARIQEIEHELTMPEKVLPRFKKKVTGFERELPLMKLMEIIAKKRYSQFPLYNKGKFQGLITLRGIGFWLATEATEKGYVDLHHHKACDLIFSNGKTANYQFVSADTFVFQVEKMFKEISTLEAVLITDDGNPDGNLLGIIRPKDV
ncbi:putative transcriptional regulator [Enterococcus sp. PF1-24]|uniref:CBS domain-containing protein n=1 Tax=unclassified Enterococcus TaxID=2608891 RepID=UPI0024769045|nr:MULTISPECIES: CBS domain-containing protein [unclassified Enterococcus]MDH6364063.1 putative transcriptional regulator [Enterococcus sp. PFB1-1]MDH6401164.1 putative transcriptional regulator [Enterococcus sp. PF1-24]